MFKSSPQPPIASPQSSTALQILDVLEASSSDSLFTSVAISSHHNWLEEKRATCSSKTGHTKWKIPQRSLPNINHTHTNYHESLNNHASNGTTMWTAGGESSGLVSIWQLVEEKGKLLNREPVIILAHSDDEVTSVCFGNRKKEMLCSASSKLIKLWNIKACLEGTQKDGVIIGTDLGNVTFVKFSDDDNLLCIGLEETILIYHINEGRVILQLDGHQCPVTEIVFLQNFPYNLISVSEDRTFKIWDIRERKVLYKSAVLSPYPIICVCEEPDTNRFFLGFMNGIIQVYEISNDKSSQCLWVKLLHEFDLSKKVKKFVKPECKKEVPTFEIISSEPVWKQQHAFIQQQFREEQDTEEIDEEIYAIKMNFFNKTDSNYIMICSRTMAIDINLSSFEITRIYNISKLTEECHDLFHTFACKSIDNCTTRLIAASAVESHICVMDVNHQAIDLYTEKQSEVIQGLERPSKTENKVQTEEISSITLHSDLPIYLKGTFVKITSSTSATSKKGSKSLKNHPTTFTNRIKSSGYSEAPFMLKKKSAASSISSTLRSTKREPLVDTSSLPPSPPIHLASDVKLHTSPIMCLSLSPNKESICTGSNSGLALLSKLPLSKSSKGVPLEKHSNSVTSLNWSLTSKLLLSSSSDCSAMIWKNGKNGIEPVIHLKTILGNIKNSFTDVKKMELEFKSSVNNAQFFHQDKLIVLSSSNKLYFYKYYIHKENNTDQKFLKKQVENHKYKLSHVFESKQAQKISALSCPNIYLSNYMLMGYSSKSLELYDVCKDTVVRSIESAHERPIHTITLNNSPNASSDSINLFLTSAVDGCVKLWDFRQKDYVRRYSQHKNSIHTIGTDFSPCMRYLACGSEDRCVYLYDLTTSEKCVEKIISCHSDVVSDVEFKNYSTLLSCSFDGKVNCYSCNSSIMSKSSPLKV